MTTEPRKSVKVPSHTWRSTGLIIGGTPAQFAALAAQVSRHVKHTHEGLMWDHKGYLQSGLFHVSKDWTDDWMTIIIGYGSGRLELPLKNYGWIEARAIGPHVSSAFAENTLLDVSLLWPLRSDAAKSVTWAWGKLHDALREDKLIING